MIRMEDEAPMHIPPRVLAAAGMLLLLVMVLASAARLTGVGVLRNPQPDPAAALASRDLKFADRPDGSIEVRDAADGAVVQVLPPESHGFIRGSMRALVRERTRRSLGDEMPFRVASWHDGRLTLQDLATGTIVDLRAFGADNAAVFAELLPAH
jgi:putative photosynthetic complex assembly protein